MHMQDFEIFTAAHVNQKLRKMWMDVYAVVAPYPVEFPDIKNACLEWSWRQTPQTIMVPVALHHLAQIVRRLEIWDVRVHAVA